MAGLRRVVLTGAGLLALAWAGAAAAQENLDQGKTPAQLFASDCAICHKSAQGLSKAGGVLGVADFLREHYTASRESAAAIAAYLQAADQGGPAPSAAKPKRAAKGEGKGKSGEKKEKPDTAKSDDKKTDEAKPSETKPSEAKSTEAKPSETKSDEKKPAGKKTSKKKPPAEAKSDKPDTSDKSDKPDKPD